MSDKYEIVELNGNSPSDIFNPFCPGINGFCCGIDVICFCIGMCDCTLTKCEPNPNHNCGTWSIIKDY